METKENPTAVKSTLLMKTPVTVLSRWGKCPECGAPDGRIHATTIAGACLAEQCVVDLDMCEYCRTVFESGMAPEEVETRQRDNKIMLISKGSWSFADVDKDQASGIDCYYYNTWLLRKYNSDLRINKEEIENWLCDNDIGTYSNGPGRPFGHAPSIQFLNNGRLVLIEQSCGLDV